MRLYFVIEINSYEDLVGIQNKLIRIDLCCTIPCAILWALIAILKGHVFNSFNPVTGMWFIIMISYMIFSNVSSYVHKTMEIGDTLL